MSGHTRWIPPAERDKIITVLRDTLDLIDIVGTVTRTSSRTTFTFTQPLCAQIVCDLFKKLYDAFQVTATIIQVDECQPIGNHHVVIMWNAWEVAS